MNIYDGESIMLVIILHSRAAGDLVNKEEQRRRHDDNDEDGVQVQCKDSVWFEHGDKRVLKKSF